MLLITYMYMYIRYAFIGFILFVYISDSTISTHLTYPILVINFMKMTDRLLDVVNLNEMLTKKPKHLLTLENFRLRENYFLSKY